MDASAVGALVCCFLVLASVVGVPVGATLAGADSGAIERNGVPAQEENASIEGYDEVHVEITLTGSNGSADWTVQYRYRLDENESAQAWERIRPDVENRSDDYVTSFERRWEDELTAAENATDREMELSNFEVSTANKSGVQEYGFVTFQFTWSSFALVEMNRVVVGDAMDGFVLDDRTRLKVTWPEEYNATAIEPEPDDRRQDAAVWRGGQSDFVDDEPRIELIQTGGEDVETPSESNDNGSLQWVALAGIAMLAAVALAGWWVRRDDAVEATGDDGSRAAQPDTDRGDTPRELLSNEERVLRLLEDHDGRIKQQEVVSELDWTEAKTSQVVRGLREDGAVDVFRIGRENVLTLPDDDEGTEGEDGEGDGEGTK